MPLIPLPLIRQWNAAADLRRTDCGAACVAMLLNWYGKLGSLTVDQLAMQTTLATADVGLNPDQLVALAKRHGLALRTNSYTTLDQIRAEISAGRPVIALIAFRFIPERLDQSDAKPGHDGHFIVVTGFDDTHFIVNDPDVWSPYVERGHALPVTIAELDQAIGGGYYRQCVFSEEAHMPSQVDIDTMKAALSSAQIAVDTLRVVVNGLLADAPAPVPPLTSKVVTAVNGVNVRRTPAAVNNDNKIGSIAAGGSVTVQLHPVAGWYQIVAAPDPTLVSGYVSALYVSDGG